jgi:hypothetical protein
MSLRGDGGWDENDAGNADNYFVIGTLYVTRGFVIDSSTVTAAHLQVQVATSVSLKPTLGSFV